VPLIIRPDLILTETGYIIAEIDSVPGGVGLTGWLNQTYAPLGSDLLGGATGMLDGFRGLLPNGGDVVISAESSTYRPEMNWIVAQLNKNNPTPEWRVLDAETYEPTAGRDVYRFFEMFDLPNLPRISSLMKAASDGRGSSHTAAQAISRGKDVVRSILDATAARILATRTR
jgi:hypothetical protein